MKIVRVVLDTNVFMSGIFWSGPPARILNAWRDGRIKLVTSPEIIEEYVRVGDILSKKYPGVNVKPFIDLVMLHGELVSAIDLKSSVSRDPDDDKFIFTAVAANCKIIVSGDSDLLDICEYNGIAILKPASFLNKYLD